VAYTASGECLVLSDEAEGIHMATFDMEDIRDRRGRSIWGNAYRRPHRYGDLLKTDRDEVWQRTDGNGKPYDPAVR
jgi:hypothetical protein